MKRHNIFFGATVFLATIIFASLLITACGEENKGEEAFEVNCKTCHSLGGEGGTVGPALDTVGSKYDAATIVRYVPNPTSVDPNSKMPPLTTVSQTDLQAVADFLASKK